MGEQKVSLLSDEKNIQEFVRHLLNDVQAMKYMLDNDWFESDIVRIGAEQEMCLTEKTTFRPACVAMEALEKMKEYEWVETELSQFNLEIGLTPVELKDGCLRQFEEETLDRLSKIQAVLDGMNTDLILTGILPTLKKDHLEMKNLTPKKRYAALMKAINSQMLGSSFRLSLKGIDELMIKHSTPLLEACNTSFQVHLQVAPKDFVKMYNISQAITGPILSVATNSPLVFGRRLWHESRIAMFQQSLDTRTFHEHMRERTPRVTFGNDWLQKSIMEIYQEDIARFRVLIAGDKKEDSLKMIKAGKVPHLRALQVHNSTVYRWNRPCYGISPNGKPHLRIENRVFPSGPTVLDEVSNAAFWIGTMVGMFEHEEDIRKSMSFLDARDNFEKAARFGMDSEFTWFFNRKISSVDLALNELIPLARKGLQISNVNEADIDRYLGVIEERVKTHRSGARWHLRAYSDLLEKTNRDEALTIITAATIKNQRKNIPIHLWELPKLEEMPHYKVTNLIVSDCMETDIFTVQKKDPIELVAEMLDWKKLRYTPVEDNKGKLVGLVTSRIIMRNCLNKIRMDKTKSITVEDVMIKDPITVHPNDGILKAVNIMKEKRIGCLPVVFDDELVGVITEGDFIHLASRLIEQNMKH